MRRDWGEKGGDARFAINLLWLAGKSAERENVAKISETHVLKALPEGEKQTSEAGELADVEKKILDVLKERGKLKSSELYVELDEAGVAERTARKYIERLEKQGMVKTETVEGRGKWRNIWLAKGEK